MEEEIDDIAIDDIADIAFEEEWNGMEEEIDDEEEIAEEIPEEIPEWVKVTVDNIEEFKRLCEVHCGNDEVKILEMTDLRRKTKNRAAALRSRERRVQQQHQQHQLQPHAALDS